MLKDKKGGFFLSLIMPILLILLSKIRDKNKKTFKGVSN
jgi:hypothetical protein